MESIRGYTEPVTKLTAGDFESLVQLAWAEDMPNGDITTDSLFNENEQAKATLLSKDEGVLCGTAVIDSLLQRVENQVIYHAVLMDGSKLSKGSVIGELSGSLAMILKMERIMLNFLQYLSGIATNAYLVTQEYPNLVILDTRKTLPGYRKLAKYAVHTGGGWNHRLNLSEMAMLKDNHIAKAGSIQSAVSMVRKLHPTRKIELEIDGLAQLDEAISASPDIILLDNFSLTDTREAILKLRNVAPLIKIECSGGITPDKLKALSEFSAVGVSMGYLTHTVRFLDISLEIH
ncbi:carboxylating nicotinate-nucleotide diphosphorylase [Leptospira ognonensis]|uniref:Probable nicotinate-nucleotide pyrophosphorylase [carboxylating] n=1 Tax=Leptospira ognonensis TaxID=2484945 RepID=A0A4R9JXY4_9LEPT|nr:carboxylating nicotinate-nucleotide diphosphorylase [Leptospira ognonensis]TGL58081.1 carboxylating nicotinate-nucleotide diphosphorylase [Leptospira ognonensis]